MLRSQKWLAGDDEVSVAHRVALRSVGLTIEPGDERPVIGIADSSSELNPCNLPLRKLADAAHAGILSAGGLPVRFPTMSLGEDLMKPSAFLYRNLLAMEIEEMLRSNPLDGIVLLANCDKTVPATLMGAASANLPAIAVLGGARPVSVFRGKKIGTGTDLWRAWEDRRAGRLTESGWAEFEACLSCGVGACNTMGTASTMALMTEALGMALPGASTSPSGSEESLREAHAAGVRAVELVRQDIRPRDIMTLKAFENAVTVLHAIGGSTNAVIHLPAIAGRLGLKLGLVRMSQLGEGVPVLADVEPSGTMLIHDFHEAGGLPVLARELNEHLNLDEASVSGLTLRDIIANAGERGTAIRTVTNPLFANGSFSVVSGSLAPDGAVIKTSAATASLFTHTGPALVFDNYDDMRARIDDPELNVTAETVLVLKGCGPVGVPGMPEWGMIPIPAKLAAAGVTDMVRVSDSRMSGTSFGTVFLHVAPEAAVGGPIAFVRDGDLIAVNIESGSLDLLISPEEFTTRRAAWVRPVSAHLRGWPALYEKHVTQAPEGCDFDFLQAPTPEKLVFVEPVVGRS
ncbi:L-arabinonate dehydratase [Alpinimonas psychrophila]|uniref:Dihydroxy-acid dehydratase n=1 Tax=Alpinimonas psychrophila TaxID=748908 RepID=A0A7W3JUS9_9MICO|nr:dihydroxy-acid dehydratase [Alpinimonas psychrophila]MBA8829626.1 dihydroxy-acid dehydratase [Alpinimonas psychrophila]